MDICVLVCPTPGCGNYFGHSDMPDLTASFTGPKAEDRHYLQRSSGSPFKHTRAECPDCRVAGRGRVVRELVTTRIVTPEAKTAVPELPASGTFVE